jgi:hypothetical protein
MGWMVTVVAAVVVVRQHPAPYTQELSFRPCVPRVPVLAHRAPALRPRRPHGRV